MVAMPHTGKGYLNSGSSAGHAPLASLQSAVQSFALALPLTLLSLNPNKHWAGYTAHSVKVNW